MAEGENASLSRQVLSQDQRRALLVLGSLFLRMGLFARARKVFAALIALEPTDVLARRCLAAAHLGMGEGEQALEQLEQAMGRQPLPSRDAGLYLLKARALCLSGRPDEAKNAVNAWIAAGGQRQ